MVNSEYINCPRYIANGHTIFNVINALVFLLLLPRLVQLTMLISPRPQKSRERYQLPKFDTSFIDSPIAALAQVKGEIINNAQFVLMSLKKTASCIKKRDDDILGEREVVEEYLDETQKVIIKYLTTIYQGDVNEPEAKEISEMMRITNNIERIGDSMENVSKIIERIYNNEIGFSDQAKSNLAKIADKAVAFLQLVVDQMQDKPKIFMIRP